MPLIPVSIEIGIRKTGLFSGEVLVRLFLSLVVLIGSISSYAAETPQESFVGCFDRVPGGALQFGAVPSGELFTLTGDPNVAEEHVNQLVRVFGDVAQGAGDSSAKLTVMKVEALAGSCTAVSPSSGREGIPGKVGEDLVAVPRTNTSTEGRTTPGYQTEAPTKATAETQTSGPRAGSALAPTHAEQAGESESDANLDAGSVERTEIWPGTTLGVNGSE